MLLDTSAHVIDAMVKVHDAMVMDGYSTKKHVQNSIETSTLFAVSLYMKGNAVKQRRL